MPEAFSARFSQLDPEFLTEALGTFWGITEFTYSAFGSERDDTLKISSRDGDYVVKIAHPQDDGDRIQRQLSLMRFVAEGHLPFATQAPIATLSGENIALIEGRIAHLLPFLPGMPIRHQPLDEEGVLGVGRAVWKLQQRMVAYPDSYDTEHPWALPSLGFAVSRLDNVEPGHIRQGCEKIIYKAIDSTLPRIRKLPHHPTHNDAHTDNVLVAGQTVVGLVDWGDSVSQPHVADLAVAASYARGYHPRWLAGDPWQAAHLVRRGYVDAGGPDGLADLFGELVLARLAQRIVLNLAIAGTAHDGGAYAKRNMVASVRDANDLFISRPDDVFPELGRTPLW